MTRAFPIVWLALVCVGGAPEGEPETGWANKLFKNQTTHDFGTVARGAQLYHRFPITNIYAVPLEITNTRVSCGCLTVTAEPKVLEPRATGYIEVAMDARRFNGAKTVTAFITVGPKFISTAELKISANSRADIVFNPGQVSFGSVAPGQDSTQTIDVEYAGMLDWKITELMAKDLPFEATYKELYRRPGQVGYQIKLTLKNDVPPGALKKEFHVRTNDPSSPIIPVHVEADVQSSISVSPSALRLGDALVGDALTKKVVVRGVKPFKVLGVDGLGDGISLASEPSTTAAQTQVVTLKIDLTKAGELRRQLRIRTDHQPTALPLIVEANVREN